MQQQERRAGRRPGISGQRTRQQVLSALPSFSLEQLAERWDCKVSDVEDLIKTERLRADVLLPQVAVKSGHTTLRLKGHFRVPPGWATRLLDPLWQRPYFRVELDESDPLTTIERLAGEVELGPTAIVPDPRVDHSVSFPLSLRVRREEVERIEGSKSRDDLLAAIRKGRARGGRAPKRLPGIWERVVELVNTKPGITASEAWKSFPDHEPGNTEALIYRDGNTLVEVDDRTGNDRAIAYDTFRGYLKAARRVEHQER